VHHHRELASEPGQAEDWRAEEDTICGLQCADSLAVGANRIGEVADGGLLVELN
jgi:hypothetical protein